jgi:ankyrin repeat protein
MCNVDAQNLTGITALQVAIQTDKVEVVRALLAAGAALEIPNDWGMTAPDLSLWTGDPAIVRIIGKTAKAETKQTALLSAISMKNAELVHAVLDVGADPKTAMAGGVIQFAVMGSTPEIVDILLDAGAPPDLARQLYEQLSSPAWGAVKKRLHAVDGPPR